MRIQTTIKVLPIFLTTLSCGTAPYAPQSGRISNPFLNAQTRSPNTLGQALILRTKKGDGTVEMEIPQGHEGVSDFVIPISQEAQIQNREPASASDEADDETQAPGISDLEITRSFPRGTNETEGRRREIEKQLGLVPSDTPPNEKQKSYLSAIDHLKRLFRSGRYEAALLKTDELIQTYPTNPRLYEMRGTLFERVGHLDLAIKAWKQALRLNPKNDPLRKLIERKEQRRSLGNP